MFCYLYISIDIDSKTSFWKLICFDILGGNRKLFLQSTIESMKLCSISTFKKICVCLHVLKKAIFTVFCKWRWSVRHQQWKLWIWNQLNLQRRSKSRFGRKYAKNLANGTEKVRISTSNNFTYIFLFYRCQLYFLSKWMRAAARFWISQITFL